MVFKMKFKLDPKISALFDLDKKTYQDMKEDIQAKGIQMPLVVAEDGTIVCGHQRYRMALELGRCICMHEYQAR